jgi:hypothetical protein
LFSPLLSFHFWEDPLWFSHGLSQKLDCSLDHGQDVVCSGGLIGACGGGEGRTGNGGICRLHGCVPLSKHWLKQPPLGQIPPDAGSCELAAKTTDRVRQSPEPREGPPRPQTGIGIAQSPGRVPPACGRQAFPAALQRCPVTRRSRSAGRRVLRRVAEGQARQNLSLAWRGQLQASS